MLQSILSAQEARDSEEKAKFGGDPWTRPKATGDWCGVRNGWADRGFTIDLDATYTFQYVAGGGWKGAAFEAFSNEGDTGHTLSGDLKVELDTGKAGGWDGGRFNLRAEGRTGRSVLQRAGTVSAVNNDALFPNVVSRFDEGATAITELTVSQAIGEVFELFAGLLNPSEGDENELAGSALANGTFLNTGLLYSLVEDATVPNVSLGGGVTVAPSKEISGSFAVFGSAETAGRNPFADWHGTTLSTEWTVGTVLDERPGGHTFGALYGINARRTDIAADPRLLLGAVLQGFPVPRTEADTWALYYNGHQYLSGDDKGGWGVFARFGISDGNPNPVRWNAALGLGGIGLLPGRPEDRWGVGAFYLDMSDEDLLKGLGVSHELGGEVFYTRRDAVVPRDARRTGHRLGVPGARHHVGGRIADPFRLLTPMRAFFRHALDPVDRLGEILFGLIMALGFTGAVRLGREEADNHALFIGILGCNIAWGIVDGVMYALGELFERGRRTRMALHVQGAPTEEAAVGHIARELRARPIMELATDEERRQIHQWVLAILRRADHPPARLQRVDVLGGMAVALLIILCTAPIVAPFLFLGNPNVAVRLANAVGLLELFLLGAWWGRMVGVSSWRIATGLTLVGLVLVAVTIVLGG